MGVQIVLLKRWEEENLQSRFRCHEIWDVKVEQRGEESWWGNFFYPSLAVSFGEKKKKKK